MLHKVFINAITLYESFQQIYGVYTDGFLKQS